MYTPRSLRARRSGARNAPAAIAVFTLTLVLATALSGRRAAAQTQAATTTLREAMVRGETLLAAGQYQFALREFEALRRGRAAERTYHDYIGERPTDAVGYANLVHVLASLGRNDDALQSFRNAQRLDPRSAAAARGAGLTLQALGRKQEALRALREA